MVSEIQQFFRDHGISEVEAIIPDMAGIARGKIMPAAKFAEDEGMRLPESVFLQTVTGDYPPDPGEAMSPAEIDIVLKADPKTVRRVPWAAEPTAQVIHDCFYSDGRRVSMAPRHVLRNVLELYAQRGWEPVVAPELEFYLIEQNKDSDYPLRPPVGRSGRAEPGRQSYSIAAVNEFDPLFDDIYQFCEDQDFSNGDGTPSNLFFAHIAGLQKYMPAAMALFCANVNSYRRLTRYLSAPINVHWGYDNRTAGLRVPMSSADARRVENRVGGADANPYIAIAASLACGYLGMIENLQPTDPITGSAHDLPFGLPRSLDEALRKLRESQPLVKLLGEAFVSAFTIVKEAEYEVFLQVISSWEREHLLLNV
jgi:glutamine synthetase